MYIQCCSFPPIVSSCPSWSSSSFLLFRLQIRSSMTCAPDLDLITFDTCRARTCPSVLFLLTSYHKESADGGVLRYFHLWTPLIRDAEVRRVINQNDDSGKTVNVSGNIWLLNKAALGQTEAFSALKFNQATGSNHKTPLLCWNLLRTVCVCMLLLIWRIHWFIIMFMVWLRQDGKYNIYKYNNNRRM